MPSNRLIASENRILHPGEVVGLTTESIPPDNPMTMSASIFMVSGGPLYFDAIENQVPSSDSMPMEPGDELDVIGAEDLRLVRLMATSTTRLDISYFGGGDQV